MTKSQNDFLEKEKDTKKGLLHETKSFMQQPPSSI